MALKKNLNSISNVQTQTFTPLKSFLFLLITYLLEQFSKPFSKKLKQSAIGYMKDGETEKTWNMNIKIKMPLAEVATRRLSQTNALRQS